MFKKLFSGKQNEDPTLREKNLSVYKWGRKMAWAILIGGLILSYLLCTWIVNFVEALIWTVCDLTQFGKISTVFSEHVFSLGAVFTDQEMLAQSPISLFANDGNMIDFILRTIVFAFCAYAVIKAFMHVHVRYQNLNHHEQGDDRFAYVSEVKNETTPVPDRRYRYDDPSGIPMMHEFNMRGRINNVIAHQLFDLMQYFHLDPAHDSTGHAFDHYYACVKLFLGIVVALLLIWAVPGFFTYNVGGTSSTGGHVGFSSFWIILVFWWIVHFIVRGFFDIIADIFDLQLAVFSLTLPAMLLVLLFEGTALAIIIYHIWQDIKSAYKYGTLKQNISSFNKSIASLGVKMKRWHHQAKHPITTFKNASTSDKQDSKVKNLIINIKDPVNHVDQIKYDLRQEGTTVRPHDRKDKSFWRKQAIRSITYPLLHGRHPFWKHPKRAVWMAFLQFLQNELPLKAGTTGWYFMTHGNGTMQNVLLYGITRSGKGQMIINTLIDINSRATARFQKNMIFNDSKGELAAGESQILKQRGYGVKVLNIMDPSHSMSYNPLADVISETQEGEVGAAAKTCSILADTIYNSKNAGSNKFFYDEAASLFDSIVFAIMSWAHSRYYGMDKDLSNTGPIKYKGTTYVVHDDGRATSEHYTLKKKVGDQIIYYLLTNDFGHEKVMHSSFNAWSKVTIHNTVALITQLGGEPAQTSNNPMDSSNRMIAYFEHIQQQAEKLGSNLSNDNEKDQFNIMTQATAEFEQSKIAGGGKTAGSIYTTFLNNLKIYQQPMIAKMTSMNSFHPEEMGFDRLLTVQFSRTLGLQKVHIELYLSKLKNGKRVPGHLNETADLQLSNNGIAQIPFDKAIPADTFFVKLVVHDERVNQSFPFMIRCDKEYYTPEDYEAIYEDFHRRPSVADLEIIEDNGKTAEGKPKWRQIAWLKTSNNAPYRLFYKIPPKHKNGKVTYTKFNGDKNKLRVIDRYTKKTTLRAVKRQVIQAPDTSVYANARQSPVYRLRKLNNPKRVIRRSHFLYNPHPTALFLVTPPNSAQLNQLCTFLINQTFNTLSSLSLHITKGRHTQRPLQFILDELGNIPAIPDMAKKLSIGLSQHVEFLLVFQNTEQITNNYGKTVGPSMVSNCSTIYYILSQSEKTLDNISKACGNRTIMTTGRNADPTKAASANFNGGEQKQPVITPTELRHLLPGQMIIIRSNDRTTVSGKSSKPWPIFDYGKYIMPFSFTFLKDFESSESLDAVPVVTPHKYLDLHDATIDFSKIYGIMEKHNNTDKLYPDAVAKDVENSIAQSGLSKDAQNLLSNIIIDKQNGKGDNKGQEVLQACAYVKKQIPLLTNLKAVKDVAQLSQYALSVIVSKQKNGSPLMLGGLAVDTKLNGERMLDFIANEKETALEYTHDAQNKMKKVFSPKKLTIAKQEVPFIFGDKMERIMGFFKLQIENSNLPSDMSQQINSPSKSSMVNESWLINLVNYIFNDYLVTLNVLKINEKSEYELTDKGKFLIDDKQLQQHIQQFLSVNPINYQNNALWTRFFTQNLRTFHWIYKHPTYQHFYGLAFALDILSINSFEMVINFKHKNQTYSLNAKPITYFAIVFPFMHSLLTDSNQKISQIDNQLDVTLIKRLRFTEQNVYNYYKDMDNK